MFIRLWLEMLSILFCVHLSIVSCGNFFVNSFFASNKSSGKKTQKHVSSIDTNPFFGWCVSCYAYMIRELFWSSFLLNVFHYGKWQMYVLFLALLRIRIKSSRSAYSIRFIVFFYFQSLKNKNKIKNFSLNTKWLRALNKHASIDSVKPVFQNILITLRVYSST